MKALERLSMRRLRHQKPPSLHLASCSRETSPRCPSVISSCDADDEDSMSFGGSAPSRPLSVAIPPGPYCPRRPTLQEVLSNKSTPPWTLSGFMAYLSQNHCLETLEFTMDASRYRQHYEALLEAESGGQRAAASSEKCTYVRMLWQKLLDAYIVPNGPREVNLPSVVRDELLLLPNIDLPPAPDALEPAVKIIYELMDESVLVPFLNSVSNRGPHSATTSWTPSSESLDNHSGASFAERRRSLTPSRSRRESSPPDPGVDIASSFRAGQSPRMSHQSHISAAIGRGSRLSHHMSHSSGASSATDGLSDDSSPSPFTLEPMTPPTTPPTSDAGFLGISPGTSPRSSFREGSAAHWKKVGAKLGWKKSLKQGSSSNPRYPATEDDDQNGNGHVQ